MRTEVVREAEVARRVVDGVGVVVLVVGAVVALGTLIQHAGAWAGLVSLVALMAAGQLTAAVLSARYDGWRADDVAASGGCLTAFALVTGLLLTDPTLCARFLVALAALAVLGLRLSVTTALERPGDTRADRGGRLR